MVLPVLPPPGAVTASETVASMAAYPFALLQSQRRRQRSDQAWSVRVYGHVYVYVPESDHGHVHEHHGDHWPYHYQSVYGGEVN